MYLNDLIEYLIVQGFEIRAYSGRNMHGGHCVAAVVPCLRDIALLGADLHHGLEIDNYALEFIAYWPRARLPDNHELLVGLNS